MIHSVNHSVSRDRLPQRSCFVLALICAMVSLLCFGGLWPDIDGGAETISKRWLAVSWVFSVCAALAFYQESKRVGRRRIAFEVALWFIVTALIGTAMAG